MNTEASPPGATELRRSPVVVLVGPSGAGKTTVGRLLAGRLRVPFLDLDLEIERITGKKISEIFAQEGEPGFRALEREVAGAVLARHDGVLALGGGTVTDAGTCQLLAAHRVAFLEVGLAEAVRRVGRDQGRPLLTGDVRARLEALINARRPLYEEVATLTIRTDGLSAGDVAEQLVVALARADPEPGSAHYPTRFRRDLAAGGGTSLVETFGRP